MFIYRVEHKESGNGPFRYNYSILHTEEWFKHTNQFPTRRKEFQGLWDLDSLYLGCETPCQLLLWFGKFLPQLIEQGFQIIQLEVKDCLIGNYQVAFLKENIILSPSKILIT